MISTTAAINTCATAYQWHHALELLKNMADRPDVSTYSSALSACDLAGRWLEAFELVEEMARKGLPVDGMHVGCVVGAAFKALGHSAARAWLERLRSTERPLQYGQLGESIGGGLMALWRSGRPLSVDPSSDEVRPPPLLAVCLQPRLALKWP